MRSVGYDSAQQILEIEFTSGAVYQYFEVPAAVFEELMHAESKGQYFNQEIRDDYTALREPTARRGNRRRRAGR
jgi:hypothetical protein